MSIIKLSIVKNFKLLDMAACYSFIKHHKLKSGAGEEEIGDSQEPLRIILLIYKLFVSYGLKKKVCTISLPRSWKLAKLSYPLF